MNRSKTRSDRVTDAETADSSWRGIYKMGGTAAWIAAMLLLVAIVLDAAGLQTGATLQDNFLVLLFKLHAGFSRVQEESLGGLRLLDAAIVALVGTMSLALYPALKRVSKAWAIVAVSLPFIGLGLFIITQDIGRSGIIAAGLISSAIMLQSDVFGKGTAYVGILANISLLVGDVGTAFTYSSILAVFIGIGYVLFVIWCVLIGWRLFQLGLGQYG